MSKLKFTIISLPLAEIIASAKTQARDAINKEAVKSYTEIAKAAKEKGADSPFPPLVAFRDKETKKVHLSDGYHRKNSLAAAGFEKTDVKVAEVENAEREALHYGFTANTEHGVRLTNEDKKHNLMAALKDAEWKELSNNALAELIGASEFFVRQHRPVTAAPTTRNRVNKATGKVTKVDTSKIGRKGGVAKKKSTKKSVNTPADQPDNRSDEEKALDGAASGGEAVTATQKQSSLPDDAARSLTRICNLINGHNGIVGKDVETAVLNGTLPLTSSDLKEWATTSDKRVRDIAPLVISAPRLKPRKAFAVLDKVLDSKTTLAHLINLAIGFGGYNKGIAGAVGDEISDGGKYRALVWNSETHKVTIEAA